MGDGPYGTVDIVSMDPTIEIDANESPGKTRISELEETLRQREEDVQMLKELKVAQSSRWTLCGRRKKHSEDNVHTRGAILAKEDPMEYDQREVGVPGFDGEAAFYDNIVPVPEGEFAMPPVVPYQAGCVSGYVCPGCGQGGLPTLESAGSHCKDEAVTYPTYAAPTTYAEPMTAYTVPTFGTEAPTTYAAPAVHTHNAHGASTIGTSFTCPTCSQGGLPTLQSAIECCPIGAPAVAAGLPIVQSTAYPANPPCQNFYIGTLDSAVGSATLVM